MRFRAQVEFWFEVESLGDAGEAVIAAQEAARAGLGKAAIADPQSGAIARHVYEPIDDAARAALDAEDLGHGISGSAFRVPEPPASD